MGITKVRRSEKQRAIDMTFIAPLYLKGRSHKEIADELGLTVKQVSSDITRIQDNWRDAYIEDLNQAKMQELARIDLIEKEAWQSWERSKGGKKSTSKNVEESGQFGTTRSAGENHEQSHGDIQYLQTAQWCVNQRCRLLGLYAPAKVANTDVTGQYDAASLARNEILSMLDSISGRVTIAPPSPQNLLEAMRNDTNVIEAEFTPVPEKDTVAEPVTKDKHIDNFSEGAVNEKVFESADYKTKLEIEEKLLGYSETVVDEEVPEEDPSEELKRLLSYRQKEPTYEVVTKVNPEDTLREILTAKDTRNVIMEITAPTKEPARK